MCFKLNWNHSDLAVRYKQRKKRPHSLEMSASIKKINLRLHVADKGKDFGLEEGAGFRCGMYIMYYITSIKYVLIPGKPRAMV